MKDVTSTTRWILLADAAIALLSYWSMSDIDFYVGHSQRRGSLPTPWDFIGFALIWWGVILVNVLAARPSNGDPPWVRNVLLGFAIMATAPILYLGWAVLTA